MKSLLIFILGLLLLIVGALFSGANDTITNFDYLLGDIQWPLSYLLIVVFIAGMFTMALIFSSYYLKSKNKMRQLQRKNRRMQQTVEAHKPKSPETKLTKSD